MRSPCHEKDIYKIGLTRTSADRRAEELSRPTGTPLPFGVLAQWEVGNCRGVEAEVHRHLARFRLNRRREFFMVSLSLIVATVERAIADVKKAG
jgi:hypothetical protein